jgi:gliding motility-associated-like protein
LPTTSNNGITGTWSPALNNTATTTYTFTPDAGQCASITTLTITVNSAVTPTFDAVAPICSAANLAALPTTSTNGITGTWSPALNNTATTTYTFTPDAGQCASATTITIIVNDAVTPTFDAVVPICSGANLAALPTASNNGITGTWSPALNNTATTTYTFTPDAGQCASTTTLTITVNNTVTPTFAAVAPICAGANLAALPTTSTNGIAGTWSPALNNTATTTYTFTPDAGQCASTTTLTITVNDAITPTFAAIAPICVGANLAALPTTSTNGITGTWSPALNNTATTTYTFTPDAGQCASTTTLTITVNNAVTPTFNPIVALCLNSTAPALPTVSTNGITGTWNPAIINTSALGATTYTFTPDAGQCAVPTTMSITIALQVTAIFSEIPTLCVGSTAPALPVTSNNGITGTWSPATITTAAPGITVYTFTPDAGQCVVGTTAIEVTVDAPITPVFTAVPAICEGTNLAPLPTTSNNGISGTWSPALNNSITTTYTFTPTAGQCASTTTLTIEVEAATTPLFDPIAPICAGGTLSSLPTTSVNGISGTWSPALNNTATTTYTFTPDAGQCASTTTLTITVNNAITPTFTAVAPVCAGANMAALPTISTNGITGTWSPALNNTQTTTYTFTPDAGQCATATTLTITVNPVITPTFNAVSAICAGDLLVALPTTSTNGITGTWSPALNNTTTTSYTFTPTGGQCASTTTLQIVVNPLPTLVITNPAPICAPGTVDLTAPAITNGSTPGLTYSYWINPTATTPLNNPAAVSVGGNFYIKAEANGFCPVIKPVTVTINPLPTASISGEGTICEGSTKTLLVSFTGVAPYQLVYSDGVNSITVNSIAGPTYQLSVAPATTTTYSISSVSDANCVNTAINSSVVVSVESTVPGERYTAVTASPSVPLQLTARTIGNDYTYSWAPAIGLNNPTLQNPVFTYDRQTEYLISLTSAAGCVTVDTLLVEMTGNPDSPSDIFVPNAWTPNGDGHNDKLFPIPVRIKELKYFRVFNRWGQLVFETNILWQGWDGIFQGQPQVMDTYTWTLEAVGEDGTYFKRAGNAVLIR